MVIWMLNYLNNLHWVPQKGVLKGVWSYMWFPMQILKYQTKGWLPNIVALNANHSTIQQFHTKFCCLIKKIGLYR
jgi:hypothetical protein